MKRFTFRLQAVLTLRQRGEQLALEQYGAAIRRQQAALEQVRLCDMELSEARRQWLNELADGCPALRAAQMLSFAHSLEEKRRLGEQEVQAANGDLARASQRMLAARQHREAVENLMLRQHAQHEAEVRDQEQKAIEDLTGRRSALSLTGALLQKPGWN